MIFITLLITWEQIISWSVLIFVLYSVVKGRFPFDLAALGGLLFLGLCGISPASKLFSGFSSPALFTVAAVLVLSSGIVESGILSGLGISIARVIKKVEGQILSLALATGLLSAFMNNVGAIGLIIPTAQRMAARAGISRAVFGIPLVYASILGGAVTLIGTASNIIVSAYRLQALGKPFKMFDFAAHGLSMLTTGLILWFVCRLCGYQPLKEEGEPPLVSNDNIVPAASPEMINQRVKRRPRNIMLVLISLIPVLFFTSIGLVHPAIGFGFVCIFFIGTGILKPHRAYQALNIPVLIFLGSMLSLARILEETGALSLFIRQIIPLVQGFPPFFLVLFILYISAFLANILDNSVAAVLMAPTAISISQSGMVSANADALLMAVAAGASLGLVLPTHQATMVTMASMGFSRKVFIRTGAVIALAAGIAAAVVITLVWCK